MSKVYKSETVKTKNHGLKPNAQNRKPTKNFKNFLRDEDMDDIF